MHLTSLRIDYIRNEICKHISEVYVKKKNYMPYRKVKMALVSEFLGQLTLGFGGVSMQELSANT